MKLLDLFAGIGGFSLAAHWMGWQTAAFVEKEPFCQKVLRKNFGAEIEIHDDIFNFSGEPFRGRVDIVTGGFPCQPFSAAGKRKGRNDERHLFPEMLRVIREVQPCWVIAENVRGLLSIESGSVYAEVIASLESEGFEVVTFCVPASAVEAPHRRDRLWIVARNTEHAKCNGQFAGAFARGLAAAAIEQSTRQNTATDAERADRIAPNTASIGRDQGRTESAGQFGIPALVDADCNAADAENIGRRGRNLARCASERKRNLLSSESSRRGTSGETAGCDSHASETEHWIDAAARTCVRRVDDGLSDGLHVDGSRDNRTARLKALGNSIVPQIAFEIFKAIEAADGE